MTDVVPILKRIRGIHWNAEHSLWCIPLAEYPEALKQLNQMKAVESMSGGGYGGLNYQIAPIDRTVIEYLNAHKQPATTNKTSFDRLKLPAALASIMYEFQKRGVEYVVDHGGRAQIADDMGLGKTIQAIAVSYVYRGDWPILVICPSSVRLNWKAEFLKWLPRDVLEPRQIHCLLNSGTKKKPTVLLPLKNDGSAAITISTSLKAEPKSASGGSGGGAGTDKDEKKPPAPKKLGNGGGTQVVIISYDLVSKFENQFAKMSTPFKMIICDESHYIKVRSVPPRPPPHPRATHFTSVRRVLALSAHNAFYHCSPQRSVCCY